MRCIPFFHKYGAWTTVGQGPTVGAYIGNTIGWWLRQERTCKRCNKVQIKVREAS